MLVLGVEWQPTVHELLDRPDHVRSRGAVLDCLPEGGGPVFVLLEDQCDLASGEVREQCGQRYVRFFGDLGDRDVVKPVFEEQAQCRQM